MAKKNNLFSRIRLVYRRSRPLTKIVVLAAIVLSMAALLTLHFAIRDTQAQTEDLRAQAAQLEQDNNRLETYIDQLGTIQGIVRIAQEELGLVDPNTTIFEPKQ